MLVWVFWLKIAVWKRGWQPSLVSVFVVVVVTGWWFSIKTKSFQTTLSKRVFDYLDEEKRRRMQEAKKCSIPTLVLGALRRAGGCHTFLVPQKDHAFRLHYTHKKHLVIN